MVISSLFLPLLHYKTMDAAVNVDEGYYSWGTHARYPRPDTNKYLSQLRDDYKMRLVNDIDYTYAISSSKGEGMVSRTWNIYYQMDIRINPCYNTTLIGRILNNNYDECCMYSNQPACQDHPNNVIAGVDAEDMHIAYIQNSRIPTCINTQFDRDPNCGAYIEIHRAEGLPRNVDEFANNNTTTSSSNSESILSIAERRNILVDEVKEVLAEVQLNSNDEVFSGYVTTYIDTSLLCAGKYELWWVIRTSSGPYVQFRKPFTVIAPSCTQLQIIKNTSYQYILC